MFVNRGRGVNYFLPLTDDQHVESQGANAMIGKLQRIHNFTLFAAAPRVPPPVNQLWMIACATNHRLRCLIERVSVRFSKVALEDVKV